MSIRSLRISFHKSKHLFVNLNWLVNLLSFPSDVDMDFHSGLQLFQSLNHGLVRYRYEPSNQPSLAYHSHPSTNASLLCSLRDSCASASLWALASWLSDGSTRFWRPCSTQEHVRPGFGPCQLSLQSHHGVFPAAPGKSCSRIQFGSS